MMRKKLIFDNFVVMNLLVVLLMLTTETAWADNVSYYDASGAQQTATNVNKLNENSASMTAGWYVADDNLTINSRVSVSGDVNLILKDGVELHIPRGINVLENNSLTIYGQQGGTGALTIDGVQEQCAGIGVGKGSGTAAGTVTICGGVVNVKGGSLAFDIGGQCGFLAENSAGGTINIWGGQVTTSGSFGIGGINASVFSNNATVTLGYSRTSDFIKVSSFSLASSVTIVNGVQLSDGSNSYSGTLDSEQIKAISNKTLRPYNPITVAYLDMNGYEQLCNNCNNLTDRESTLVAGWYVAEGTVNFDHHVRVEGDVHIILKDGAVVNIGTETNRIVGFGLGDEDANHSISIYGQSTGTNNGQLNVYSTKTSILALNGDVSCSSVRITASGEYGIWAIKSNVSGTGNINLKDATVNATGKYGFYAQGNVSIDGGQVTATGNAENYGILAYAGVVTISNGEVTATGGQSGIFAQNGSVTISGGKVTATGTSHMGIEANSVTISGGVVSAEGSIYGIHAQNGDVNISGGQVVATGNTHHKGIFASGNITLGWTRSTDFISANGYGVRDGSISIAEGKSFIDEEGTPYSGTIAFENDACAIDGKILYFPIALDAKYLDMNGEQQTCPSYIPLTGTETTLAADWYVAEGTINFDHHVSVAGDVHIILKDGAVVNVGTAESPIDGFGIGDDSANHSVSIYGQSTGADNGQLNMYSTRSCIWAFNGDFNCSSARITALSSQGYTIWALNYTKTGTGNLKLKDATVDVTGVYGLYGQNGNVSIDGGKVTATGTASNYGIFANTGNVTVSNGEVTATGGNAGIYAEKGNVAISGGKVTANGYNHMGIDANGVTISGGVVSAEGSIYGINAQSGDVNISGGQVVAKGTASSYNKGIFASGSITLGWTRSTDFISTNGYGVRDGSISIAEGKFFIDEQGTTYSGPIAFEDNACAIDGKTLRPYSNSMLFLADDAVNTAIISKFSGQTYDVTLAGRTLYKDDYWNTLCLPFSINDFSGTPLAEATVMELDVKGYYDNDGVATEPAGSTAGLHQTGLASDGTLYLYFKSATEIVAGTPYLIKWNGDGTNNLEDPVFTGVTINADMHNAAFTGGSFKGTYMSTTFESADQSILFLGTKNTLYYPQQGATIGAQRAYFDLGTAQARQFVLRFIEDPLKEGSNFGQGDGQTGIAEAEANSSLFTLPSSLSGWYTLDGRRLNGMPAAPGLYIHGNKKFIIK